MLAESGNNKLMNREEREVDFVEKSELLLLLFRTGCH